MVIGQSKYLCDLAAGEGVEPSTSESKSEVLPVTPSRNELVDPTGLKPAPHGLKGRCSVSRAPGQKMAVAEGLEPSHGRINSAVPYQLGYATIWWLWVVSNHQPSAYETLALST